MGFRLFKFRAYVIGFLLHFAVGYFFIPTHVWENPISGYVGYYNFAFIVIIIDFIGLRKMVQYYQDESWKHGGYILAHFAVFIMSLALGVFAGLKYMEIFPQFM